MGRRKLVIGISGASGAIFGVRLVELLHDLEAVECHLIVTPSAALTIEQETEWSADAVKEMASCSYEVDEIGAAIASGSFPIEAMAIVPCSMKSLGMLANSVNSNLLIRAADVCLKERRKLVLVARETPLHLGHLRLMTQLAEMGAIIMPPVPAFYAHPKSICDLVDQTVGRILDILGLDHDLLRRWEGVECSRRRVGNGQFGG